MKKFFKSSSGKTIWIETIDDRVWVHLKGHTFCIDPSISVTNQSQITKIKKPVQIDLFQSQLNAPFPARVVSIKVCVDDFIQPNQHLMVIDSMKMEHTLSIPYSAKVQSILVKENQTIDFNQTLITFQRSKKSESNTKKN